MQSQKTLEVNPRHPIVAKLNSLVGQTVGQTVDEPTQDLAWMLLDNAMMTSGFPATDADAFAQRVYRLIQRGLEIDNLDLHDEVEIEASPAKEEADEEEVDLDDFGANEEL